VKTPDVRERKKAMTEARRKEAATDSGAVRLALAAVSERTEVPAGVTPVVRRDEDEVVVTWPTNHPVGVRGADFHAQVTIDAATGEVKQVLGGA
jgi:hypothetical protein